MPHSALSGTDWPCPADGAVNLTRARKLRPKMVPPVPHGLATAVDPALGQQIIDVAERQRNSGRHRTRSLLSRGHDLPGLKP